MKRRLSPLGSALAYPSDTNAAVTGASSAGEAGTVTIPNVSFVITGAASAGEAGIVTVSTNNIDVNITGAASAAEAGAVTVNTPAKRLARLSPLILPTLRPANVSIGITGAATAGEAGTVTIPNVSFQILGRSSLAQGGVVTPVAPPEVKGQLQPFCLIGPSRQFSPAPVFQDVSFPIVGAEIRCQWSTPSLSDIDVYAVSSQSPGESGIVTVDNATDVTVPITGAATAGEAGAVTVTDTTEVSVSGAASAAEAGMTNVVTGAAGINVTVVGAASAGQAGTVTAHYDYAQAIVGAAINASASEVGIDTTGDVSATITGAAISMLTSDVGFLNWYPVPIVGAEIEAQAQEVASGFGEDNLGISDSTDRFNGVVASQAIKTPCRTAALSNITLSGHQTINGLSLTTGDRVLVVAQTDPVENGIWVVDSSDWERAADFDGNRDIVRGTLVTVTNE